MQKEKAKSLHLATAATLGAGVLWGTSCLFVRSIFLNPQPSAQAAFDEAMERYGEDATVIAMPFGGATLPIAEA